MIVVADSGPLIHLGAIRRLELLRSFGGQVLVPSAVFDEVAVRGAGLPGSTEVAGATWLSVVEPADADQIESLIVGGLDRGEAAAIVLARERAAELLIIDERRGRTTACAMGLRVVGSAGVLLAAKRRGDIDLLAPELEALRASGFWLSQALVERLLAAAGELSP